MFADTLEQKAKERDSRLVLALDEIDFKKAWYAFHKASKHIVAVKVHPEHALLWHKSHDKLVAKLKMQVPLVILDAKLADIGESNAFKARYYYDQGYDAIICHGFAGLKSVQAIVEQAQDKGVLLLVAMTPSGHLFDDQTVEKLFSMAQEVEVSGVIAPGNQYELLKRIRQRLASNIVIFSPGIGAQGGEVQQAFEAGTNYAIVGRAILQAEKPGLAAKQIKQLINKAIK